MQWASVANAAATHFALDWMSEDPATACLLADLRLVMHLAAACFRLDAPASSSA